MHGKAVLREDDVEILHFLALFRIGGELGEHIACALDGHFVVDREVHLRAVRERSRGDDQPLQVDVVQHIVDIGDAVGVGIVLAVADEPVALVEVLPHDHGRRSVLLEEVDVARRRLPFVAVGIALGGIGIVEDEVCARVLVFERLARTDLISPLLGAARHILGIERAVLVELDELFPALIGPVEHAVGEFIFLGLDGAAAHIGAAFVAHPVAVGIDVLGMRLLLGLIGAGRERSAERQTAAERKDRNEFLFHHFPPEILSFCGTTSAQIQPLTAPTSIPFSICFWKNGNAMSMGSAPTMMTA